MVHEPLRGDLRDRALEVAGEAGSAVAQAEADRGDAVGLQPLHGCERGLVLVRLAVADHEQELRVATPGSKCPANGLDRRRHAVVDAQHDVFGFEVAVHDAARVHRLQRRRDLPGHAERAAH